MACLLIDYENECGRLLEGISLIGLTRKDKIIIFYSKRSARITMEFHKELERLKAQKEYLAVETGTQDALDFQLSTYLGLCIHENPNEKYYIVSKDKGYECVCHFWRDKNIFVKRIAVLSDYKNS